MDTLTAFIEAPAWPILLWCGLAASLAAILVLPPPNSPGAPRRPANWPLTLILGVALFAPLYGLGFDAIGRADVLLGAAFGLAHGLLAVALALRTRGSLRTATLARTLFGWIVYGATVGFLYPVPTA